MLDGFLNDLMIDPASFDRAEAKRICRLFLSGLFLAISPALNRRDGLPPGRLRTLQVERAETLARLQLQEAALLDALARGGSVPQKR
jgi:hypothetical protein